MVHQRYSYMARTNKHRYEWRRQWLAADGELNLSFEEKDPNQLDLFSNLNEDLCQKLNQIDKEKQERLAKSGLLHRGSTNRR